MPVVAFRDGEFSPLSKVAVGIAAHALHYGTSVFDGLRAYCDAEAEELYLFRAEEHYTHLHAATRMCGVEQPHSVGCLRIIGADLLVRNGAREDAYVRPLPFNSSEGLSLWHAALEDSLVIFQLPMGSGGVRCCVSLWRRPDGNTAPAREKIGGIYAAMALALYGAMSLGFDEALTLTVDGKVAEGTGENIFLLMYGKLVAPARSEDLLVDITRVGVIELATSVLGMEVAEQSVNRNELCRADEVFLSSTAAEVTPVLAIDGHGASDGHVWSIAKAVRDLCTDVVRGKRDTYMQWCRSIQGQTGLA